MSAKDIKILVQKELDDRPVKDLRNRPKVNYYKKADREFLNSMRNVKKI